MSTAVDLIHALPFKVNLRAVQNRQYDIVQHIYPDFKQKADAGDAAARQWVGYTDALNEKLLIKV